MCEYWYYRKQKIETFGYSKVLIVCEKGSGLRNFKILARNGSTIEIGFSIGNVSVSTYNICHKNYTERISQAYYVLDVETGKIRRAQLISADTVFPKGCKRVSISFCAMDYIDYKIVHNKNEYAVRSYNKKDGEECSPHNLYWLNIKELPENIFVFDFKTKEVQTVHVITFLH